MVVAEDPRLSADYLDPAKRSLGNSVEVVCRGRQSTGKVVVEYPLGHRRRRDEGIPLLLTRFERNLRARFSAESAERILEVCADQARLEQLPVPEFVKVFVQSAVQDGR